MLELRQTARLVVFLSLVGGLLGYPTYRWEATVNIDPKNTHPVSDKLYGLFFEEIGNAGEGGLYAELIQDRSFDALAYTTGFLHHPNATSRLLSPRDFEGGFGPALHDTRSPGTGSSFSGGPTRRDKRHELPGFLGLKGQPQSWVPLPGTAATLTKQHALSPSNLVAMHLSTDGPVGGIANTGFWGIPVLPKAEFNLRIYLAVPSSIFTPQNDIVVRIALESSDGQTTYSAVSFTHLSTSWTRFEGTLGAFGASDTSARLSITFNGPGVLLVDFVSLFPAENAVNRPELNPRPFRKDLLDMLKALKPRFLRFPGGCYVEGGDWLKDAFSWKTTLGRAEDRPGHWSGAWGYWSTDGLGLYEYMQLAEELGAAPVWVINNGISHREDTPIPNIGKWVQDALDSIEFTNGPADSTWGAVRASMGRVQPWNLSYLAIGNEDCGHPSYLGSYLAFFYAIRQQYPHMRLIANCNMGTTAPTDIWDWHVYLYSWDMFMRRYDFNGQVLGRDPFIFASEYASVGDAAWGNLRGAIGEAGFMTGLDRNSQVVHMASYAPLLVNANARTWAPDLIVFNNHQAYGIPSYYVQKIFAETQGVRYAQTDVSANDWEVIHNLMLAASTTCFDDACTSLAIKVVNMASFGYNATIRIAGVAEADVLPENNLIRLTGDRPESENSFSKPLYVSPEEKLGPLVWSREGPPGILVDLPPYSLVCLLVKLSKPALVNPGDLGRVMA